MTIEYKDGRYFIAQIFIPGNGMDFLGTAYRDEGKDWELVYRFRYYASDDPHDERDEKKWFRAIVPQTKTEEEVSTILDAMAAELVSRGFLAFGTKVSRVELRTANAEENAMKIVKQPYSHISPTSAGGDA
jgi:hypothetical protein